MRHIFFFISNLHICDLDEMMKVVLMRANSMSKFKLIFQCKAKFCIIQMTTEIVRYEELLFNKKSE